MGKLGKTQEQIAIEKGCKECGYTEILELNNRMAYWVILTLPGVTFNWDKFKYRVPNEIAVKCSKQDYINKIGEIECDKILFIAKDAKDTNNWKPLSENDYIIDWDRYYYKEEVEEEPAKPGLYIGRATVLDKIEVMNSFAHGNNIQCKYKTDGEHRWKDVTEPNWDWFTFDFRVKKKAQYRPYCANELIELMHTIIVSKNDEFVSSIIGVDPVGLTIRTVNKFNSITCVDAKTLLNSYISIDKKPLGIKE